MAKNNPSETRISRTAYCCKSLLPSSANWANRFQSISCPSAGGCAATTSHIKHLTFSANHVNQTLAVSGVKLCSRQLCCKSKRTLSLANSRASRLCVYPFDPLSAPSGSREWIRKVLCFPRNLVAPEFHDAHGIGRLAVICQDEFGDPKITAANDSSDSKLFFARLTSALALYVASPAGLLA